MAAAGPDFGILLKYSEIAKLAEGLVFAETGKSVVPLEWTTGVVPGKVTLVGLLRSRFPWV